MKKGFTLVELLAVIVILSVIALISSPIVLNIVKESKVNRVKINVELYLDAVNEAVSNELMDSDFNSSICEIISTGNLKCDGKVIEVITSGKNPTSGIISFQDAKIKSYRNIYIDKKYVSYSGNKMTVTNASIVCTYEDVDNSKSVNLSDVVTCDTESFYVMKNDGTNITMLSKYNLDVGIDYDSYTNEFKIIENPTEIQNAKAIGYNNKKTQYYGAVYQDDLPSYLNSYEKYLQKIGVNSAKTSIMSYEQANLLGCNYETYSDGNFMQGDCTNAPKWLYSTSYHISDFCIHTDSKLENVYCGCCDTSYGDGVRPVVTISVNEIEGK